MNIAMTESELIAAGLCKTIDGSCVLNDVSLSIGRGDIVALLGPAGAGKSTCFKILTGVMRPDSGRIGLSGEDVTNWTIDSRARLGLGYVPQAPELFERLSVRDNLEIAAMAQASQRKDVEEIRDRVVSNLHLKEIQSQPVAHLSGGQRRLVEIAFAVCTRPRFLLLDEPFAGLDPIVVERVTATIRTLAASGIGILLTDHKARLALTLADRAVVIAHGAMIAEGPSDSVAANRAVRQVFLGDGEEASALFPPVAMPTCKQVEKISVSPGAAALEEPCEIISCA